VSHPISIVIPTLADHDLLSRALESLQEQQRTRSCVDEILVVDDSGDETFGVWLASEHPQVRVIVHPVNLGFARSVLDGVQAASHEQVMFLNPDVLLRPGCLEALQETLDSQPHVAAVAPYVLLNGTTVSAESLPHLLVEEGLPRIERRELEVNLGHAHRDFPDGIPVAFALGGACLLRRDEYLAAPFDSRFEPFYWEDVDLGQCAWEAGRSVLVDPRAVAEHHHRGTIGARVPESLVRAAIEKNRLLFAWKHLDEDDLAENLHNLAARVIEHDLAEDREALIWLLMALEQN
jgi:GT2 family glycosyltransferase